MISGGILQSELLYPGLPVAMLKGQRMISQDLVLLVVVQSKHYIYNIYIYVLQGFVYSSELTEDATGTVCGRMILQCLCNSSTLK